MKTRTEKRQMREVKACMSRNQWDYLRSRNRHRVFVRMMRVVLLLGFCILWEAAVTQGWIDGFIFSSPHRIWNTFLSMVRDGTIAEHVGATLMETIISFLLVVVTGLICAVLLWCSEKLSEILEPYLVVLNSLPKSALAPLLIVWLGANQRTIIVAGMSVAVFGTILNLYTGFKEVSKEKSKLVSGEKRSE